MRKIPVGHKMLKSSHIPNLYVGYGHIEKKEEMVLQRRFIDYQPIIVFVFAH
jgi:hypothetical protein